VYALDDKIPSFDDVNLRNTRISRYEIFCTILCAAFYSKIIKVNMRTSYRPKPIMHHQAASTAARITRISAALRTIKISLWVCDWFIKAFTCRRLFQTEISSLVACNRGLGYSQNNTLIQFPSLLLCSSACRVHWPACCLSTLPLSCWPWCSKLTYGHVLCCGVWLNVDCMYRKTFIYRCWWR
jgi:hypothetical protein